MKWLKPIISCVLAVLFVGCATKKDDNSKYAEKTEREWLSALHKIGFRKNDLDNTVILITYSTHCPACLNELSYWNKLYKNENYDVDIVLCVIERYESRFRNFLNRNNLTLPSYQDTTGLIIESDLIPQLPVKVYFNSNSLIRRIHYIGNDEKLDEFVNEFSS